MTNIDGDVARGWGTVRDTFEANFATTEEVGAAVCVYHRGHKVVDLRGGSFDVERTRPYDDDTLQLVFSTTKGITAVAVGMCVDRGLLDYGAPVAKYWPEFAAHGKGEATVAQLLAHRCGLYTVDGPMTLGEVLDWPTVTARLADTAPRWPIGSTHGYHAVTYGFLAGELVRHVDPQHRSLGTFVREEIAEPMGIELYIGLPHELEARVSPLIPSPRPTDPAVLAMIQTMMGPGTPIGDALSLNGAFGGPGDFGMPFNTREVHAAEIPAANAITNAASLAKMYAATVAPIDGTLLLSDRVRDIARTSVTPDGEPDACLMVPTTFGMGFMVHGAFTPYAGAGSYGHPGAGGSVAFAQPERELAFGYVMNRMADNLAGDLRAQALIDAAAKCADAS